MSYKDTLELYDELVAAGTSEAQARAQAKQLGSAGLYIETALDRFTAELNQIHKRLDKIEIDLLWMRLVGGAMALAFLSTWFK